MSDTRELVILGGGLVGMTLALAAAKLGIASHVVDMADPASLTADGFDGRASAISTASWNLFANIGLAERLEPQGCPIDTIAVTDAMKPGRIDFKPEPHEGSLGVMFANRVLRQVLFEAARDELSGRVDGLRNGLLLRYQDWQGQASDTPAAIVSSACR